MAFMIDLTGKKFGKLSVIRRSKDLFLSGKPCIRWMCICDCGKEKDILGTSLRNGATKSCGCAPRKKGRGKETIICAKCNKKFIKRRSDARKYCSKLCRVLSTTDEYTPFKHYFSNITGRSRHKRTKTKISSNLTINDLKSQWEKQSGICPYTGIKMTLSTRRKRNPLPYQASIDRIDHKKGYDVGNIQFVSLIANYAKNSFSSMQLIEFSNSVATFLRDETK